MQRRRLGDTPLEVSELGFGAWQLGNGTDFAGMDDATAHRLVDEALDAGITLFDTAPNYAGTASERLLGEALGARRHRVVLVSKFGHPAGGGAKDFRAERLLPGLQDSLRRLRTDYLDVLLLHNPGPGIYRRDDPIWEALDRAQERGLIRHYGASVDFAAEIEACLAHTDSQVLEVLFNVFHQDVRRAFPLAAAKGVGLIVKVPLDSGWLTGRFGRDTRFEGVRARWTPEQIAERAGLVDRLGWLTAEGLPLATAALAFTLTYDEVACVIPGMRSLAQLRANLAAAEARLGPSQRVRLEEFWAEITDGGRRLLPW